MKFLFRSHRWLLLMLASTALAGTPVFAAEIASEAALRAALLFNFIKFTEWPAALASNQHLQVCISSNDPELVSAMESINARQVRGKAVLTVRYQQQTDCDVIYFDTPQRWNSLQGKHRTPHPLTVGGYTGFVDNGGMIEIDLKEGGTRFDINQGEAKRAGLRFYPQLLKLARRIVE
jgi:hypothetical protein